MTELTIPNFVHKCDDGSILIEFVKKDRRFGISFDEDLSESSWYYVDKRDRESAELLTDDMIKYLRMFFEA